MTLVQALRGQRQRKMTLCEFEATLVCRVRCRTVRATQHSKTLAQNKTNKCCGLRSYLSGRALI